MIRNYHQSQNWHNVAGNAIATIKKSKINQLLANMIIRVKWTIITFGIFFICVGGVMHASEPKGTGNFKKREAQIL
jgi:hypothetical protein